MISAHKWVGYLAKFIADNYGGSSRIVGTIYTDYKTPLKEFEIPLTQGGTIFDHDSKPKYDVFLGSILKQLDKERRKALK